MSWLNMVNYVTNVDSDEADAWRSKDPCKFIKTPHFTLHGEIYQKLYMTFVVRDLLTQRIYLSSLLWMYNKLYAIDNIFFTWIDK